MASIQSLGSLAEDARLLSYRGKLFLVRSRPLNRPESVYRDAAAVWSVMAWIPIGRRIIFDLQWFIDIGNSPVEAGRAAA